MIISSNGPLPRSLSPSKGDWHGHRFDTGGGAGPAGVGGKELDDPPLTIPFKSGGIYATEGEGVRDVAVAKKGGLKIENMVRSSWVYQQLRRFRAGIEGCISTAKRVFGLSRCLWKGWPHFQRYVHLSVVSYNLLVLARLLL